MLFRLPEIRIPWQSTGVWTYTPAAFSHAQSLHQYRRHVFLGSRGPRAQDELCAKNIHSFTRHVSLCASQRTEHQHKFSLTYLSCVTVVLFSEPRPVVHASICPLWRSTAGWYFYGIPLLQSLWAQKRIELNRILVNPQNQINDDQDDVEKPLSYGQPLIHSAYRFGRKHCDATQLGPRRRTIT